MNTGVAVTPGVTKGSTIKLTLFPVPEAQELKVPLLHSLLAVWAGEFEIVYDDKAVKEVEMVDDILSNICTSWTAFIFPHPIHD